ncbi:peptidoglycan-binding domain-containing protein [Massilia sp. BKSP1R2A-1]|jgi:hypothetical protein|uniref:peptidoglycan-binding domain-containing protein n=1 Tax=Massilia sp. BKSP1R2A-1 TaxID=3422595 RepID=UPI003D331A94
MLARLKKPVVHLLVAASLCAPVLAQATSAHGEFGVKGIGASDCATAVREYKGGTPNAMMYGGWLYGYLTAVNQATPDTFDLATWQDLNTLTNFVIEYCQKNPRTSFAQAVFNLTAALKPMRLTAASQPVRFTHNNKPFVMYGDVIKRMGEALKHKGYYKGTLPAQPAFTGEMARAVSRFQAGNQLPATGEPDQFTLFKLFGR